MKYIFGFMFLAFFSCSQKNELDYIKNYFPHINKAEKFILSNNYTDALKSYKIAFSKVPYDHSVDLFNAMVCAIQSDDFDESIAIAETLFKRGLHLSLVMGTNSFDTLSLNQQDRVVELFNAINKTGDFSYNISTKSFFQNLLELDQKFRGGGAYNYDPYLKAKVDSVDRIVLNMLFSYVKENGFPTDADFGIGEYLLSPVYDIILLHYVESGQLYDTLPELAQTFKNAIKYGKIRPSLAFGYLNYLQQYKEDNCGFPLFFNLSSDDKLYYIELSDSTKKLVDKNRMAWGLPAMVDQRERVYQSFQPKFTDFILNCNYCIFNISSFGSQESWGNFLNSVKEYNSIANGVDSSAAQ